MTDADLLTAEQVVDLLNTRYADRKPLTTKTFRSWVDQKKVPLPRVVKHIDKRKTSLYGPEAVDAAALLMTQRWRICPCCGQRIPQPR